MEFILSRIGDEYFMTNYTQYYYGTVRAKSLQWGYKKMIHNFYVLLSSGNNFLSVTNTGGNYFAY